MVRHLGTNLQPSKCNPACQQLRPRRLLCSKPTSDLLPLDNNTPLAKGTELIINIPINPHGSHDHYIDDIINLMVNIPGADHVAHGQGAALLAIDV
jgi:hypothetical protein